MVLDGTWEFARNMFYQNEAVFGPLRKVCLDMATVPLSEYAIRRQPHAGFLCTLEAVAYSVAILEGDPTIVSVLPAPRDCGAGTDDGR